MIHDKVINIFPVCSISNVTIKTLGTLQMHISAHTVKKKDGSQFTKSGPIQSE